ncbi:MAG TPA: choice-of-anchor P family protein [Terriglobia bacterium]|nr:choice-of-anchor P family protein [Terriglobia bacterium]
MKIRLLAAALSILMLSLPKTAAAACLVYGGRATVVQANGLGIVPVVLSDTGNLDSTGGAKETSLRDASVLGLVTAQNLHAAAVGQGSYSYAEASMANVNLTVLGNTIGVDFLMARASAGCGDGGATVKGASKISGLTANGQSVMVTGLPNQTVYLPGGVLMILNEQTSSVQGLNGSMIVNALHVTVPGLVDTTMASPYAMTNGGGGGGVVGDCKDFVTGGGQITNPLTGAKGNFGVAGGVRNLEFWGHLTYIDHGTGMKVKGTGVTAYTMITPTTRLIEGPAEINGQPGFHYVVVVEDNGEPGTSDVFSITLDNAYSAGGTLTCGNIQLHRSDSCTVPPVF